MISTLVAIAIISSPSGSDRHIPIVISLKRPEDCSIIGKQLKAVYGLRLHNYDCFGDTK